MAMTGGPRHPRQRRSTVGLVTIGVLPVIGSVLFVALRANPATDDAAIGPATVNASATAGSPAAPEVDPTPDRATYPVLRVVDGDTLRVLIDGRDESVRVIGIDAPETDECWGSEATQAATRMLEGASVGLTADPTQADRDRYGRLLRYVVLPDGADLGLRMITDGNADEYTYDNAYAHQQAYRSADAAAAAGGHGRWNTATCAGQPGDGAAPAPTTVATAEAGPDDCAIKGNISSNGRIYHMPGSADYDRTQIDESRGERWFCSAADAEAAGWRARN